ncbi:MAG TPA: CDP-alcohol phosphatidyltransferase family protein [Planctomycetota bacterium]
MDTADRRPIAARELGVFKSLASRLAKAGVTANAISVAGMVAGLLAGAALGFTARRPELARVLWVAAAAFIQLRLLANMLDGMVAIESGTASKVGELYNEVPDRVSDTAALVGLGYAAGGDPVWGWGAALAAMFTAYVRTTGKGAGAKHDFRGPMAKQQRMFLVTVTALFCAIAPGLYPRAPIVVLAIIVAGSVLTALRRLLAIARALRESK